MAGSTPPVRPTSTQHDRVKFTAVGAAADDEQCALFVVINQSGFAC
jgi:hypothetical protein